MNKEEKITGKKRGMVWGKDGSEGLKRGEGPRMNELIVNEM